LTGKLVFQ